MYFFSFTWRFSLPNVEKKWQAGLARKYVYWYTTYHLSEVLAVQQLVAYLLHYLNNKDYELFS